MQRFIIFLACAAALSCVALLVAAGSIANLVGWIDQTDPLIVMAVCAAGFAAASFFGGLITGDYSWVDRLWSTAPIGIVWFYAVRSNFDLRVVIAAILVTLWGLRLSFNFGRKGGYNRTEDYRWEILRKKITNPIAWQAFNLGFISCFQIALFLGFTIPVYILWQQRGTALTFGPFTMGAILFLAALVFETIADQQQWIFHTSKRRASKGEATTTLPFGASIQGGFLREGLFRFSRHPNYFGELACWWALYLSATVLSGSNFVRMELLGPVILTALFIGSTRFTENITNTKYPTYADYCKRTSPIIPLPVFSKPTEKNVEAD